MKRMLVNATQQEELRVAMVDGQLLVDLDIETAAKEQKKANIYKGRITRLEPSLEAAFVDYGASRHGFLPLKEISREYFVANADVSGRVNIKEVLREGQEIVVQVEKEERGTKGAALTTYLSLAGRYLVLMPNNPKAGGVSRRITGADRDEIRNALRELNLEEGMGVIVRTAGVGRDVEDLKWDRDYLLQVWEAIKASVLQRPAPFLIYQESNAIIRALRDHLSGDVGEILIDDPSVYDEAKGFMERVMPHNLRKLKLYEDAVPVFTRFQIESQIESAFSHTVTLPSGGSLVIDHTEALVSIDINSARATKGEDIEATALNTNLESATEIARQLKLRDLGGLIVIDFIDMSSSKNQREVENRLHAAVRNDRARVQIGRISRFGLLEMSRQRLRPSLGESAHIVCPRCVGRGTVRGVESLSLSILRLVAEEARKDRTAKIIAELPVEIATYLLNEKRNWLTTIEQRESVAVVIVPRPGLETPHHHIRRVRDDDVTTPENAPVSYQLPETEQEKDPTSDVGVPIQPPAQQPAVSGIVPSMPAPQPPAERKGPGLFARLLAWFRGQTKKKQAKKKPRRRSQQRRGQSDRRGKRSSQRGGERKRGQGNRSSAKGGRRGGRDNRKGGKQANARSSGAKSTEPQKKKPNARKQGEPRKSDRAQGEGEGGRSRRGGRRRRGSRQRRSQDSAERQANNAGTGAEAKAPAERQPKQESKKAGASDQKRSGDGKQTSSDGQRQAKKDTDRQKPARADGERSTKPGSKPPADAGKAATTNEPGVARKAAQNESRPASASVKESGPVTGSQPAKQSESARASKPVESKPAESQPVASKPVESKPAASKPVESKPAASKPAASQPAASKPVESKPTAPKTVASKPAESKPAAAKPVESKPASTPAPAAKTQTSATERAPTESRPTSETGPTTDRKPAQGT